MSLVDYVERNHNLTKYVLVCHVVDQTEDRIM